MRHLDTPLRGFNRSHSEEMNRWIICHIVQGKELDAESNFCQKCGVRTDKGVKEGVTIPWSSDPHWRQEMDVALAKASKAIDDGVKIVRDTFRDVAGEVEKGVKQARTSVPVTCRNCGQENTKFA